MAQSVQDRVISKAQRHPKVFSETSASDSQDDSDVNDSSHTLRAINHTKIFRVILLLSLVSTGVVSSVLSYMLLAQKEEDKYTAEFESLSNGIFVAVDDGFKSKIIALDHMSTLDSYRCPDLHQWPNCSAPIGYYDDVASSLMDVSKSMSISSNPLVYPQQQAGFEAFAYELFEREGYPVGTGMSPFGKGMFGKYENGSRYADDGHTTFSEYDLFLPVFQPGNIKRHWSALMYNMVIFLALVSLLYCLLFCFTLAVVTICFDLR